MWICNNLDQHNKLNKNVKQNKSWKNDQRQIYTFNKQTNMELRKSEMYLPREKIPSKLLVSRCVNFLL